MTASTLSPLRTLLTGGNAEASPMRTTLLLALAVLLATCTASHPAYAQGGTPATPNDAAVVAEADFIKKMVEGADDSGGKKGGDKPGKDAPADKPAKKKEENAGGDRDGDEAGDAGDGDNADDADGTDDADDATLEADDLDAGDADDKADDLSDDDAKGDDADDDLDDGGADDRDAGDGELDDVDADDEPSPKLEAALRKHGAKAVLDLLPKGLRPVVEKRLKEMEAPYTRAMQEATAFRAERATLVAEKKFRDENQVDAVLELLLADPSLGEKVNARLDEIGESTTNREAHDVVVQNKKAKALAAAEKETATADKQALRIQQVETYVRRESARLGIPLELGVEEAIALHITDRGDITREDIDRILSVKKKQADRLLRGAKRDRSRKYVDEKLKDRRTAGLKVKPNRGAAPAPGAKKTAKSDDEFLSEMDGKLAGMGL